MKPRGDGGAADGKMPAQLGSCAGIAFPRRLSPVPARASVFRRCREGTRPFA
ncbi:hypothetical protein GA0115245_13204 [Streptomyces sp. di188]|nr:hypothetical protein GA0115238_14444 [Streptomyces sp. di50b]SCE35664.1 hypothetical protein GA0115245_13204 [Streptomyces sp. di188]